MIRKNRPVPAVLMITLLLLLLIGFNQLNSTQSHNYHAKINTSLAQPQFFRIDVQVTAPIGYSLPEYTPIIFNLSYLASFFPPSADPFGAVTPDDSSDNIKWPASFVVDENGTYIPSQVDNVDGKTGFTSGDELLFQLPEGVNLASEESMDFSIFLGNKQVDLPAPSYPEVCTVYDYPYMEEVALVHGTDMLGEVYSMENGIIRSSPLVDAAWSSGGMYHLSVLNDTGGDSWDAVKQRFQFDWPAWKWARFATVEQFIELNDKAGTNPFFLPDPENSIITGPVRARIQMRSVAPYGKAASVWGTKPGVYGLVTYELYANKPYLDYTLDTTGPNAASYPTLMIELQNREFQPGGAYSPYKSLYVPGVGWMDRAPDDLDEHSVNSGQFTQPWYAEKLSPTQTMFPDEPGIAEYLGFGVMFSPTGFTNITYEKISEDVKIVYNAAEFPLKARYLPFDVSITSNALSYMGEQYQQWSAPDPDFSISVTEITENDLPFDYISVSEPEVSPFWAKVGETITISNITANASTIGFLTGDTPGTTHEYQLLDFDSRQVVSRGDLSWDPSELEWGATGIDLSSLVEDQYYIVQANFSLDSITIPNKYWVSPIDADPPKFWYGNSNPPVDITPPVISSIIQTPMATEVIRHTEMVNVSCLVSDETGIASVILQYYNGSWYNVSMSFEEGTYVGTIPSSAHSPGGTISYKISATDSSEQANSNTTKEYSYIVALEYSPGQGLIPLLGLGGILIAAVIVALKAAGMHKQDYDQV